MNQDHLSPRPRPQRTPPRALLANLVVGASLLSAGTAAFGATLAITGKPPGSIQTGSEYSFTPTVSGTATGHTVQFSIAGKPTWATFNSSTGAVTGYPQGPGTFPDIVITASDGVSSARLPAFTVTVSGANPVKLSGTPPGSVTAGTRYSFKPTASDTAGRALSYSVINKPSWATFSIATGELTGTPLNVQANQGIVIFASDGKARAYLPTFAIKVSSAVTATTTQTLAEKHPGDVGMGSDPAVVLYENFAESSVAAVVARYDSHKNPAGMSFVTDRPVYSPGPHAMRLTAGGANPATDLYKNFGAGYEELWYRYYIKYEANGPWHHSGLWFGGYNPPLPYPYPHAGERPDGADRYSIGLEPIGAPENAMDFYVYWRGMHSWMAAPSGPHAYYGNMFLHDELPVESDTWICYEIHLKVNPDVANGAGAVLEVWKNDSLVRRFDDTGPLGWWNRDKFCASDATGVECTAYRPANPDWVVLDQRWRTVPQLKINYFWPQNYNTASSNSSLLLDDMVVATQRVGCTIQK